MRMNNVTERIKDIIEEQLFIDRDEITSESNIFTDFNADSLDFVEVLLSVEDVFDIEIPDEDADEMATVADLIRYVEGKLE